jgi:hypothetical protein
VNLTRRRCWDGKSLDSPNHHEHVAHPVSGPTAFSIVTGKCPASHPVKIPQLMLEVRAEFATEWSISRQGSNYT